MVGFFSIVFFIPLFTCLSPEGILEHYFLANDFYIFHKYLQLLLRHNAQIAINSVNIMLEVPDRSTKILNSISIGSFSRPDSISVANLLISQGTKSAYIPLTGIGSNSCFLTFNDLLEITIIFIL